MAGAVAAFNPIGEDDAVFLRPHGVAYLYARLVFTLDGCNGSGRTYFATAMTFRATIATLIRHRGLHQSHQVGGRTEHIVGTFSHTELASRAVAHHVLGRERAWGRNGGASFERFLLGDGGKSAVHLLFLLR